jgi:hypothetical protein
MHKELEAGSPRKMTIILTGGAIVVLAGGAAPAAYSAAWPNFVGALLVAAGGILGTLSTYGVRPERTRPDSWTLVVAGGALIAGASLRAALNW